jgi:hypothetical protein
MSNPGSALPFLLRRKTEHVSMTEVMSTTDTVHGLLRLENDALVIQWSTARETKRVGMGGQIPKAAGLYISIGDTGVGTTVTTDRAMDPVREVRVPLGQLAGAEVRWRWRGWVPRPMLVLRASDLRAFEALVANSGALLDHPGEVSLGIRRKDRGLARSFAMDLEVQLADHALEAIENRERLRTENTTER